MPRRCPRRSAPKRRCPAGSSASGPQAAPPAGGAASGARTPFLDSLFVLIIAHGLVGRADLPVPEGVFIAAAAVVLVVSFLALAGGWSRPRLQTWRERRLLRLPLAADAVLGVLGVLAFAVTVYAGLAGTTQESDNLAPTMVYVLFWVGVPVASLLLGDIWRLLSPWRAVGRAVGSVARRVGGEGLAEALPYPARLGRRPAAVGVFAFAVCELCWATAREPSPLAVLMLI